MTLLKDIVLIEKGRKYNLLEEFREGAIRVFQANDFRNENKLLYTFDAEGVLANDDDILLVWDGSVGQMGFGKRGYVGSTMVKLKVKNQKEFSPFFIYKLLQTKSDYLKRKATGATIKHINRKSLEHLEIPEISITEQKKIADLLSKSENLITQRKESIRLLYELLKSTYLEMFGDSMTNRKKWDKIELKYFGKIITGNTPSRSNAEYYSSNFIEWIKTDNITIENTYITKSVEYLSETGLHNARTVDNGALLVACIAGSIESVGRAALTNRKVSFNQQINAIQPNVDMSPLFLYWLFKTSKKYIQDSASKGMKKILTKGEFENIKMVKPPFILQTKFAQIVEKVEALKTQYQSSLKELENLYGNLSQRAFNGELISKNEKILMAAEPKVNYLQKSIR